MSKFSELLSKPLPSAQHKALTEACSEECGNENTENDVVDVPVTPAEEVDTIVVNPVVDPVKTMAANDEADTTELTPEESQRVDDTINAVATPLLIQSELNNEEDIKEFVESTDSDIAIAEGFLTERTIIKFDKYARKAQLYEVAVAAVAREKHDPLYKKLTTVYRMERILKAKLRKKYHTQANVKVKEYLARAKKSKSGVLAKIAAKITGK